MIGASTAVYAVSLAAVTGLQSNDDRTLAARQAPAEDAAARLRDGHDQLESAIARVSDAYDRAVGAYDGLAPRLEATEASLADLATTAQSISGAARSLPDRISLPPISRTVVRTVASRPTTSASTGASGH
jgi:hypothetical protein